MRVRQVVDASNEVYRKKHAVFILNLAVHFYPLLNCKYQIDNHLERIDEKE